VGVDRRRRGDRPSRRVSQPGRHRLLGANFIAQKNGVSPDQTSTAPTVDLGAIDALGKPYTGIAGSR